MNYDGEDALRVMVVIGEDVDVEKVDGDDVNLVKRAIRDKIRGAGIERWPYIHFARPSELLEDADEE